MEKLFSEAPSIYFPGKCVVALAADKNVMQRSGDIVTETELASHYGLVDDSGTVKSFIFMTSFL